MLRYHDTVHVLFGSDTSVAGEVLADSWVLTGTDQTLRSYARQYYGMQEARQLIAPYLNLRTGIEMIAALPLMVRVWRRAQRMTRKWPYLDHARYLDVPLKELRAQFGIEVISLAR